MACIFQFSLNNVKRLEEADVRHQQKQSQLEKKLSKFRSIIKSFIDNRQIFVEVK